MVYFIMVLTVEFVNESHHFYKCVIIIFINWLFEPLSTPNILLDSEHKNEVLQHLIYMKIKEY